MSDDPVTGRPVASQRIADAIAERILSGSLPPGTRIIQDELAEELKASRIPVREALRMLESRGLVTLRVNTGAWVSQMTLHDMSLSYQVRERIEPLLLTDSMMALSEQDLERMETLQDEIESNADVEEFLRLDREFHWTSYGRHRTPHLAAIIERLWDTTQHYRRAFVRLSQSQGSWIISAEHRLLLESMRSQDAESASTVLSMHIRRTRLALKDHPEMFADGNEARPAN